MITKKTQNSNLNIFEMTKNINYCIKNKNYILDKNIRRSRTANKTEVICKAINSNQHNEDNEKLIRILPREIQDEIRKRMNKKELLEITLDLGRRAEARFFQQKYSEPLGHIISSDDLRNVTESVGYFTENNRACLDGSLHRISAIRNDKGQIVGLTCRVGRAVEGYAEMVGDLLDTRTSILFLGRPGVGKTSIIRETARILSASGKRVIIVDESNEIGGTGDIPHHIIGGARRMQVPYYSNRHEIMIEAVENHMPEVIIADEIGSEEEAIACRSIAERGIMLIGTAHGQTIDNLIKNPLLSPLIGGIGPVTLGDEEAKNRMIRKSILERQGPPTFSTVIELRDRYEWIVHWVEDSVDELLSGRIPIVQIRKKDNSTSKCVSQYVRYDSLTNSEKKNNI